MHILIMLAGISLVGWGFSWQDERHRGSQIISSFLITRCCKNTDFVQVVGLIGGETPKLSPEPFSTHLHSCSLVLLSTASTVGTPFPLCPILTQTFYCLPWPACSKLPFNGMKTVVPNVLQIRQASVQELRLGVVEQQWQWPGDLKNGDTVVNSKAFPLSFTVNEWFWSTPITLLKAIVW